MTQAQAYAHKKEFSAELETARARIVELEALLARCEEALTIISKMRGAAKNGPWTIAREALAEVRKGRE